MKLQILTNFDKVLKTLITHFTQSNHMIVVILHKHQYLTTSFQSNCQILDSRSRALWTCVILLEQPKILIDHVLPIQLFDWAQNHQNQYFIPLFQFNGQILNQNLAQDGRCHCIHHHETSNIDQFRQSFENCDYSYFTIQPSDCCHTSQTPISHHILPIQWLVSGFEVKSIMDMCHSTTTPRNFDWSRSPNPTIWLSLKFIKTNILTHSFNPMVKF